MATITTNNNIINGVYIILLPENKLVEVPEKAGLVNH